MVEILEAGTAALPDGFVELAPEVYRDDPMWIPEDPEAVRKAFSSENPWFETGESVAFCAPGKARIAGFINPSMKSDGQQVAYFGYWETTGDEEVDDALFAKVNAWAKERGALEVFGPINFSTYGSYRLRLKCEPGGYTFSGEPYNPDYYPGILDRLGFTTRAEAVTQLAPTSVVAGMTRKRMEQYDAVVERCIRFELLTPEIWMAHLDELYVIIDAMFRENWGYAPISKEVFKSLIGEKFIRKTCPRSSTIAYDPEGNVVAFFLNYPNWGPIICQEAGERRVPLEELDYQKHWHLLEETGKLAAVSKTSATIPSMQSQGIFTAMSVYMILKGEPFYEDWFGALIGVDKNNRHYADRISNDARHYAVYGRPTE